MSDPSNYKWGLLYWNSMDKRILVPKSTGLGWTFNFARPVTYLILICFLALLLFVFKKQK